MPATNAVLLGSLMYRSCLVPHVIPALGLIGGPLMISSVIGQVIGIFAEKFAELMELGATVYNAVNPNAAEGQLLANVSAISGTFPQVATYSTVADSLSDR